ncbi:MAG: MFS transporter [Candidatus Eremiobacteraeota bacterium]|nr:MFS transporter [Candidatus Eremiobacteraeota bacterium]
MTRLRKSVAVNALWIPLTFQDTALMAIAVPAALIVLAPREYRTALAFLASVSSFAAMLVPPLAGAFSDRLRRGGGTRRPYVVAGLAIDVAALCALPFAHTLVLFDALFIVAVAGENVAIAAYQALIPESIPREQWGAAAGIRGAATLVGTVIGLATAGLFAPNPVFFATAALLAVFTVTLFSVREEQWSEPERAVFRNWNDFIVVFVARSFVFFGLTLLMTFVLYFFRDILHAGNPSAGTAFVGLFSLVGAIVSSVWLGTLSDRVSRKVVVALCGLPMAIAAIGFAVFPEQRAILAFAVLFGAGLGGIMSTGWALAMDSVPQLRDVARDLGIWGIATNFPNVIAPAIGGWILRAYGGSRFGYQVLFAVAGVSFALASLAVLGVGSRAQSSLLGWPLRFAAIVSNFVYVHIAYRIRGWGRLPRKRGPTLVIANHQHDLESMVIVSRMTVQGSWRDPIYSASSRRMYEPGFFAVRIPWLRALFRNVNAAPLFFGIGLMPLENELSSRSIASLAWSTGRRHGTLPLRAVFREEVAVRFPAKTTTTDLWNAANFDSARQNVKIATMREPYRSEILTETRAFIEEDLHRMENLMRNGATFYLTPEGRYTITGELFPMRGAWERLAPHADIYLAGVSYDAFRGRRFSMLYRLVHLDDRSAVIPSLLRARPVTVTQLLAEWFATAPSLFDAKQLVSAVQQRLSSLPKELFVDPELARNPERVTLEAIATLKRLGIVAGSNDMLRMTGVRRHPQFPAVADIITFQARFFAQTLGAVIRSSYSAAQP